MEYKVGVVGPVGVGKTAWINRQHSDFEQMYTPTKSVIIRRVIYRTSRGILTLDLYDFPGGCMSDLPTLDAYILMLTTETMQEYPKWRATLAAALPNVPLSVVVNKFDRRGESEAQSGVAAMLWRFSRPAGGYYSTSAKTYHQVEKPLLALIRHLQGDEKLYFPEYSNGDFYISWSPDKIEMEAARRGDGQGGALKAIITPTPAALKSLHEALNEWKALFPK